MHTTKNYIYHLIAILTVGIWGLTFISTKVLIEHGLSPQEIFLLRFLMAYLGIWFISPRKLFADNWKDELWLLWGGVTGGSFYFFTENTALEITLATNVAFIVCTAPLLTKKKPPPDWWAVSCWRWRGWRWWSITAISY